MNYYFILWVRVKIERWEQWDAQLKVGVKTLEYQRSPHNVEVSNIGENSVTVSSFPFGQCKDEKVNMVILFSRGYLEETYEDGFSNLLIPVLTKLNECSLQEVHTRPLRGEKSFRRSSFVKSIIMVLQ